MENSNISKPNFFHDRKYLNDTGVKFFEKNPLKVPIMKHLTKNPLKGGVYNVLDALATNLNGKEPENKNTHPKTCYEPPYLHDTPASTD